MSIFNFIQNITEENSDGGNEFTIAEFQELIEQVKNNPNLEENTRALDQLLLHKRDIYVSDPIVRYQLWRSLTRLNFDNEWCQTFSHILTHHISYKDRLKALQKEDPQYLAFSLLRDLYRRKGGLIKESYLSEVEPLLVKDSNGNYSEETVFGILKFLNEYEKEFEEKEIDPNFRKYLENIFDPVVESDDVVDEKISPLALETHELNNDELANELRIMNDSTIKKALQELFIQTLKIGAEKTDEVLSQGVLKKDNFDLSKLNSSLIQDLSIGDISQFNKDIYKAFIDGASANGNEIIDDLSEIEKIANNIQEKIEKYTIVFKWPTDVDQKDPMVFEAFKKTFSLGNKEANQWLQDGFISLAEMKLTSLAEIFRPEDFVSIMYFLFNSSFPQKKDSKTEFLIALTILENIQSLMLYSGQNWIIQFQAFGDGKLPENAALSYMPVSADKVGKLLSENAKYCGWHKAYKVCELVSGTKDLEYNNPKSYNETKVTVEGKGPLGLGFNATFIDRHWIEQQKRAYAKSWTLADGLKDMQQNYGKFFILPTKDGNCILIRRGLVVSQSPRIQAAFASYALDGYTDFVSNVTSYLKGEEIKYVKSGPKPWQY